MCAVHTFPSIDLIGWGPVRSYNYMCVSLVPGLLIPVLLLAVLMQPFPKALQMVISPKARRLFLLSFQVATALLVAGPTLTLWIHGQTLFAPTSLHSSLVQRLPL